MVLESFTRAGGMIVVNRPGKKNAAKIFLMKIYNIRQPLLRRATRARARVRACACV